MLGEGGTTGAKRVSPSVERNRDAILDVLRIRLVGTGRILEVASGTGEHVVHFAAHFPNYLFHPSDRDAAARASIDAWISESGLPNIRPAIALDASAAIWPATDADAVLCINMLHISPWSAAIGLFRGAARTLTAGGLLYLYGPYRRPGAGLEPSNVAFDLDLRERNPDWGIRDLGAVSQLARETGFGPPDVIAMPANNLSVCFRR